jgi:hypothetical protein
MAIRYTGGGVQRNDWKVTLHSEKVEWSYRDHSRRVSFVEK